MILRRSADFRSRFRRRNALTGIFFGILTLAILALVPTLYFRLRNHSVNERMQLREYFESGAFEAAYSKSKEMLNNRPLDYFLLTIHGFSAYQLAISQINNFDTLFYIDSSIWAMRKALLSRENTLDGRLFYVLGKAYFHKGPKFADLAVYYLEKARSSLFKASDIPEYLGLSYVALDDYRSSIAAFSQALNDEPSDLLLFSIARSYKALEEFEAARAYLIHCLDVSRDSNIINSARLLLGNILVAIGDISGAEVEFFRVIEDNRDNAEAHYLLGELYLMQGDLTRARAEWRRAIRIDPAHVSARRRLI
jgi:tetratricopeptide (TPR) repeat protein